MTASDARSGFLAHDGRHVRVVGPPASGKTTLLIDRYRTLRERGDRPVIIAYSRAEQKGLIERILPPGGGSLGEVPVLTYGQIASRAMAGNRRLLRDVDELLVVDRLLRGGDAVRLVSDLATIAHTETLRRDALTVIHPLLQHGISPAQARVAAEGGGARKRDLLELYAAFAETLAKRGLVTYYNAAWEASGELTTLAEQGYTHALIDDFHDIDPGQFCLIETIAPPDGPVAVEVFGDPTGARFGFRGTSDRFFADVFPRRYEAVTIELPGGHATHPAIGATVRRLLEATGVPTSVSAPDPVARDLPLFRSSDTPVDLAVEMITADDEIAEAQGIARRVADLIGDGVAPARIAVLVRDRDSYEAIFDDAFRGAGVPLDSGRRGRFVVEEFVHALLSIFASDGGARAEHAKQAVVDSPFYVQFRDAFAKRAGLRSRRVERDTQDLDRIVSLIRGGYVDKKSGHFSMARFVRECIRPFVAGSGSEAPASATVLADEWARYVEMVSYIGGTPKLDEFRYLQRVAGGTIRIERQDDAVAFYTVREAASLNFECVFVAGCSEGIFPAADTRGSYIPYTAIEKSLDNRVTFHKGVLRDEYALLLTAMTRASRHLVLSSPTRFGGESIPAPAHVLSAMRQPHDREPQGRRAAPVLRAAQVVATASTPPPGVPGLGFALNTWLGAPSQMRNFAVTPFPLSASSLDSYCQCARKFFYTKVMRMPQDKSMYLTIGSLFHNIMETLCRYNVSREDLVTALNDGNIETVVAEAVQESRDLATAGELVIAMTRHHLAQMLRWVRRIETSRPGGGDIGAPEEKVEFAHGAAGIVGRIDRIDRVDNATVVIDYKASDNVYKRGSTIKNYMLGGKGAREKRHWQVPIYSFSVRERTGQFPAGFCYYAVPVDKDAYMAGLFIGAGYDPAEVMGAGKGRFDVVSESELTGVMDEVSALATEMFADTNRFEKTEVVSVCKNCDFNRVCERYE